MVNISFTKRNSYIGYVEATYHGNITYDRIIEISTIENLTIINIKNVTHEWEPEGERIKLEVHYFAPNVEQGEQIKKELEKYIEMDTVVIYKIR